MGSLSKGSSGYFDPYGETSVLKKPGYPSQLCVKKLCIHAECLCTGACVKIFFYITLVCLFFTLLLFYVFFFLYILVISESLFNEVDGFCYYPVLANGFIDKAVK